MNSILRQLRQFVTAEDGPTAVEYAFLAGVIMVGCITTVQAIAVYPTQQFDTMAKAFDGIMPGSGGGGDSGKQSGGSQGDGKQDEGKQDEGTKESGGDSKDSGQGSSDSPGKDDSSGDAKSGLDSGAGSGSSAPGNSGNAPGRRR